jgi:hypothetical protein
MVFGSFHPIKAPQRLAPRAQKRVRVTDHALHWTDSHIHKRVAWYRAVDCKFLHSRPSEIPCMWPRGKYVPSTLHLLYRRLWGAKHRHGCRRTVASSLASLMRIFDSLVPKWSLEAESLGMLVCVAASWLCKESCCFEGTSNPSADVCRCDANKKQKGKVIFFLARHRRWSQKTFWPCVGNLP